jgi:hypothetical protein
MPDFRLSVSIGPRTLNELYAGALAFQQNQASVVEMYPWADRFVCGMPLAPWQRPVVWNNDMQSRFIDALWARVDTGSYLVNEWINFTGRGKETSYLSDVVIDGQQRLTSIERYFRDEIPATASDGRKLLWSETTEVDRRFFKDRIFPRARILTNDEGLLREAYDMRAFGGVRHTEDQRAIPA